MSNYFKNALLLDRYKLMLVKIHTFLTVACLFAQSYYCSQNYNQSEQRLIGAGVACPHARSYHRWSSRKDGC